MDAMGQGFFETAYAMVKREWRRPQEVKTVNLDFVFYAGRLESK
jgi:hypothetical protein